MKSTEQQLAEAIDKCRVKGIDINEVSHAGAGMSIQERLTKATELLESADPRIAVAEAAKKAFGLDEKAARQFAGLESASTIEPKWADLHKEN